MVGMTANVDAVGAVRIINDKLNRNYMTKAEEIYHRFVQYEWNEIGEGMKKSILDAINEALRQPRVSGELNCEHDWLVDMYDHFGFPASRFCDKCNTREAI